jgi:hypothetical protein
MSNIKQSADTVISAFSDSSCWQLGAELQPSAALIRELCECNQILLNRVQDLESELDATHQLADQRRQIVDCLMGELVTSQERVAELERECAFHQQRFHEQVHQLLQAEQDSRDLKSRLQRQQYYSLQLKAALEKSFEQEKYLEWVSELPIFQSPEVYCLTSKAPPVSPWSALPSTDENSIFGSGFDSNYFSTNVTNTTDGGSDGYLGITEWFSASTFQTFSQDSEESGLSTQSYSSLVDQNSNVDDGVPAAPLKALALPPLSQPLPSNASMMPPSSLKPSIKTAKVSYPNLDHQVGRKMSFVLDPQRFNQAQKISSLNLPPLSRSLV